MTAPIGRIALVTGGSRGIGRAFPSASRRGSWCQLHGPAAPADIVAAVAFLASEDSGFFTAQVLTVDGGRMDYIGHG